MQVENHKEEVPFEHYVEKFRTLTPENVAERLPDVPFDGQAFTLTLLGKTYRISWPEYAIEGDHIPPLPTQTFLLRYLLEGKEVAWSGTWKTFREMPWGELYIGPYTGRVLTRAAFTFGTRVQKFSDACQALHGGKLPHGDAGYELELLPGYRMQIMVYAGDEEFPPSAQVLYSDNFETGFAAEDRVVAGDLLISALKAHL